MDTFFTDNELKDMSFQELAECQFFACAKNDRKKARQIQACDFNRKIELAHSEINRNIVYFNEKMYECWQACFGDE